MRIVNVSRSKCTHYCGRGEPKSGKKTGLGNPIKLIHDTDAERSRVLTEYDAFIRSSKPLAAMMRETIKNLPEDAVLGCWCVPKACHCSTIVEMWYELNGKALPVETETTKLF